MRPSRRRSRQALRGSSAAIATPVRLFAGMKRPKLPKPRVLKDFDDALRVTGPRGKAIRVTGSQLAELLGELHDRGAEMSVEERAARNQEIAALRTRLGAEKQALQEAIEEFNARHPKMRISK